MFPSIFDTTLAGGLLQYDDDSINFSFPKIYPLARIELVVSLIDISCCAIIVYHKMEQHSFCCSSTFDWSMPTTLFHNSFNIAIYIENHCNILIWCCMFFVLQKLLIFNWWALFSVDIFALGWKYYLWYEKRHDKGA